MQCTDGNIALSLAIGFCALQQRRVNTSKRSWLELDFHGIIVRFQEVAK
jgi:hypothetical protein